MAELKQLFDLIECKPYHLRLLNEFNPAQRFWRVNPMIPSCPLGAREQALAFVVMQRLDTNSRLFRDFSDFQFAARFFIV